MAGNIVCVLLTGTLSLCWASPAQQVPSRPVYEIFAISYGVIPDFPVAGLVAGADRSRKMDIQMMVWLLKGPEGRSILVDSGFFQEKYQKQFKLKDFIKPSEALARGWSYGGAGDGRDHHSYALGPCWRHHALSQSRDLDSEGRIQLLHGLE